MNPITKRREELGLTQIELSKRSKMTYQRVWTLENKKLDNIRLSIAFRLAKALETTVDKLFGGYVK